MYLLNPAYRAQPIQNASCAISNQPLTFSQKVHVSVFHKAFRIQFQFHTYHIMIRYMWVCLVWNIHDSNSSGKEEKLLQRNDLHDEHNSNEYTLGLKWLWFQSCKAWLKYKSLMKTKAATGVCIWSVNNSDVWFRSICLKWIDFRYSFGIQTINPPDHKPNSKHYLLLWYREANHFCERDNHLLLKIK